MFPRRVIENALLIASLAACTTEAGKGFRKLGGLLQDASLSREQWYFIMAFSFILTISFSCSYACIKMRDHDSLERGEV